MRKFYITIPIVCLIAANLSQMSANAQQVDPALTAAIGIQTEMLHKDQEKRQGIQKKIIAAEAAVTIALNNIHSVENKVLKYLQEASNAMSNLYQIKEAYTLTFKDIPEACKELANAVPDNVKGTAISSVVSTRITKAGTEIVSLYSFIEPLVKSGTYGSGSNGDAKRVNLLNSAERYYILETVVSKLKNILWDIRIFTYQVKTFNWVDLWRGLDSSSFYKMLAAKTHAESLKRKWTNMKW